MVLEPSLVASAVELRLADYDYAEEEARARLPNRVVAAFQPVVFQEIGYPSRVRWEFELIKYVDVMHEMRFEGDFQHLLGGITEGEFDLVRRLTTLIARWTGSRFERQALARGSVLRSLNVYRHLRYLFGDQRPRVFEIGPGCGYLGTLLMLEGYPYAATDVSQAFYLYQHWFWNFLSDGKVVELATEDEPTTPAALTSVPQGGAVHVPWWKFAQLEPGMAVPFDVVVCNHALCEMHPDSLGFTVKMASAFLRASRHHSATFLFEGWGMPRANTHTAVTERFYRSELVLAHNDLQITAFGLAGTPNAVRAVRLPASTMRQAIRRVHHLLRFAMGKKLWGVGPYHPPVYSTPNNPLSAAIRSGRQTDRDRKTVRLEQVNRFYTQLLGREDHRSPDERFSSLVHE